MSLSKHSKDVEVTKLVDEVNKMNLRGKPDRKTDKQWTELVNDYFLNLKKVIYHRMKYLTRMRLDR